MLKLDITSVYLCINVSVSVYIYICIIHILCKQKFFDLSISVRNYFFYQFLSLYFDVFMFPFLGNFQTFSYPEFEDFLQRPTAFQVFLFDFSEAPHQKQWKIRRKTAFFTFRVKVLFYKYQIKE